MRFEEGESVIVDIPDNEAELGTFKGEMGKGRYAIDVGDMWPIVISSHYIGKASCNIHDSRLLYSSRREEYFCPFCLEEG